MKTALENKNHHKEIYESKVVKKTQEKVAEVLKSILSNNSESGTFFFRSDTGTGKTTGFISAVTELVNQGYTFAIAVPTTKDAEEVYKRLSHGLGDQVEVWTSDHGKGVYGSKIDKSNLRKVPVFVGCHAFLMGLADDPMRFIGEKDLLIIDEIPTNLQINSLTYTDFANARKKASELGLISHGIFVTADDWVKQRQKKAEEEVNQAAFNQIKDLISESIKCVRDDLEGFNSKDKAVLLPVLDYIDAIAEDRGFERVQSTKLGHIVHHVYFEDVAKHFPKSVVFSATVHLDGFQFSPNRARLDAYEGSVVEYPYLDIQEVPYPRIEKAARYLVQKPKELEIALAHIRHILSMTEQGSKVLLVVPKAIKKWVEQDIDTNFQHQNREINITNWGRDVGSNEYRNCSEVILWSNNHKPKHTTFSELCLYSEQPVSSNLNEVLRGKFIGRPMRLQESQLYAAIKQMGSRGTTRYIDNDGNAWPMRLWISWAELKPEWLLEIFPKSSFTRCPVTDQRFLAKPSSEIVPKIIDFLMTVDVEEMSTSEVANTINNVGKYSRKLLEAKPKLNAYGWDFVPGKRGRNGYKAKFVAINKNSKPKGL